MIYKSAADPNKVSIDQEPDQPEALLSSRPWVQSFLEDGLEAATV